MAFGTEMLAQENEDQKEKQKDIYIAISMEEGEKMTPEKASIIANITAGVEGGQATLVDSGQSCKTFIPLEKGVQIKCFERLEI